MSLFESQNRREFLKALTALTGTVPLFAGQQSAGISEEFTHRSQLLRTVTHPALTSRLQFATYSGPLPADLLGAVSAVAKISSNIEQAEPASRRKMMSEGWKELQAHPVLGISEKRFSADRYNELMVEVIPKLCAAHGVLAGPFVLKGDDHSVPTAILPRFYAIDKIEQFTTAIEGREHTVPRLTVDLRETGIPTPPTPPTLNTGFGHIWGIPISQGLRSNLIREQIDEVAALGIEVNELSLSTNRQELASAKDALAASGGARSTTSDTGTEVIPMTPEGLAYARALDFMARNRSLVAQAAESELHQAAYFAVKEREVNSELQKLLTRYPRIDGAAAWELLQQDLLRRSTLHELAVSPVRHGIITEICAVAAHNAAGIGEPLDPPKHQMLVILQRAITANPERYGVQRTAPGIQGQMAMIDVPRAVLSDQLAPTLVSTAHAIAVRETAHALEQLIQDGRAAEKSSNGRLVGLSAASVATAGTIGGAFALRYLRNAAIAAPLRQLFPADGARLLQEIAPNARGKPSLDRGRALDFIFEAAERSCPSQYTAPFHGLIATLLQRQIVPPERRRRAETLLQKFAVNPELAKGPSNGENAASPPPAAESIARAESTAAADTALSFRLRSAAETAGWNVRPLADIRRAVSKELSSVNGVIDGVIAGTRQVETDRNRIAARADALRNELADIVTAPAVQEAVIKVINTHGKGELTRIFNGRPCCRGCSVSIAPLAGKAAELTEFAAKLELFRSELRVHEMLAVDVVTLAESPQLRRLGVAVNGSLAPQTALLGNAYRSLTSQGAAALRGELEELKAPGNERIAGLRRELTMARSGSVLRALEAAAKESAGSHLPSHRPTRLVYQAAFAIEERAKLNGSASESDLLSLSALQRGAVNALAELKPAQFNLLLGKLREHITGPTADEISEAVTAARSVAATGASGAGDTRPAERRPGRAVVLEWAVDRRTGEVPLREYLDTLSPGARAAIEDKITAIGNGHIPSGHGVRWNIRPGVSEMKLGAHRIYFAADKSREHWLFLNAGDKSSPHEQTADIELAAELLHQTRQLHRAEQSLVMGK